MGNKLPKLLPESLQLNTSNLLPIRTDISNPNYAGGDVFRTPKSSISVDEINSSFSEVIYSHSDDSPVFSCDICTDTRSLMDSFSPKGCSHFYCINCVVTYISSKLDDSIPLISCPVSRCRGMLDPEFCKSILPSNVFDRWGISLCESVIVSSQSFYCPFRDCSVLLIDDDGGQILDSVCPYCERSFCAKCRVLWHSEISCERFQELEKEGDDGVVIDLAKRKKWRRCPNCRFYVEKSDGCSHIKCRCGCAFCYKCGTGSSITSHRCLDPKCGALY